MLQHGSWLFVGACCSLFGVFILLLPFHHYRIKNEWMKLYIWCMQTTQNLACSQCQLPTVHTWNVMRVKCFGENINRETVFSPNILMLAWFACFVLWFESHWLFVVDFVPIASSERSSTPSWSGASSCSRAPTNTTAWVGHPLDPIGVLFDTLAEACIASEDQLPEISSRHLSIEPSGDNRKRLHHIPVPGGVEPGQTYLILAFEVALIGETFFFFLHLFYPCEGFILFCCCCLFMSFFLFFSLLFCLHLFLSLALALRIFGDLKSMLWQSICVGCHVFQMFCLFHCYANIAAHFLPNS